MINAGNMASFPHEGSLDRFLPPSLSRIVDARRGGFSTDPTYFARE